MATIKSYTDIEQSKKLAEILQLESVDMRYHTISKYNSYPCDETVYTIYFGNPSSDDIPCWSLAALLDVLNKTAYFMDEDGSVNLSSYKTVEWDLGINNSGLESVTESNPVDACYEMIIKLHERNLL